MMSSCSFFYEVPSGKECFLPMSRGSGCDRKVSTWKGLSPAKCTSEALFLGSFIVLMHWFIKRSPVSVESVVIVELVLLRFEGHAADVRTLAFAKSAGYVHPVIWTLASGFSKRIWCAALHV